MKRILVLVLLCNPLISATVGPFEGAPFHSTVCPDVLTRAKLRRNLIRGEEVELSIGKARSIRAYNAGFVIPPLNRDLGKAGQKYFSVDGGRPFNGLTSHSAPGIAAIQKLASETYPKGSDLGSRGMLMNFHYDNHVELAVEIAKKYADYDDMWDRRDKLPQYFSLSQSSQARTRQDSMGIRIPTFSIQQDVAMEDLARYDLEGKLRPVPVPFLSFNFEEETTTLWDTVDLHFSARTAFLEEVVIRNAQGKIINRLLRVKMGTQHGGKIEGDYFYELKQYHSLEIPYRKGLNLEDAFIEMLTYLNEDEGRRFDILKISNAVLKPRILLKTNSHGLNFNYNQRVGDKVHRTWAGFANIQNVSARLLADVITSGNALFNAEDGRQFLDGRGPVTDFSYMNIEMLPELLGTTSLDQPKMIAFRDFIAHMNLHFPPGWNTTDNGVSKWTRVLHKLTAPVER